MIINLAHRTIGFWLATIGLKSSSNKRGPTPKLQRQIQQVSHLPRAKQKFVSEMLDAVIQQTGD